MKYDVIIVGGGPAGLSAALYLGRANVRTLVIDKNFGGGQIISSPLLENVPGFYGPGAVLATAMKDELDKYPSIEFEVFSEVVNVIKGADGFEVFTDTLDLPLTAASVMIATGAEPIKLNLGNEEKTHYCVTCDGALYKEKDVAVIGGGNSALQYALELVRYGSSYVYICTNEAALRGEESVKEEVLGNAKIEVIYNFNSTSFEDNVLYSSDGRALNVDGIFIAIGYKPQTNFIEATKERGYLVTDEHLQVEDNGKTIENLYALGDCRRKPFNQVVIAMSDGCIAALHVISKMKN